MRVFFMKTPVVEWAEPWYMYHITGLGLPFFCAFMCRVVDLEEGRLLSLDHEAIGIRETANRCRGF